MVFRLLIGILFLLCGSNFAQYFSSINIPGYVIKGSNFQVSFKGLFDDNELEQAYLYLLIDDNIQLLKAQFTAGQNYIQLPISYEKNNYGNVNKITLDKNIVQKHKNSPFQLLISFKGGYDPNTTIRYVWGALEGKKRLVFNSSFIESRNSNVPATLYLPFYDKGNKAGNLLLVKKNGYFNMPLNFSSKKLLVEYWIKLNSIGGKMSLLNPSNSFELFNISLAEFNFMKIERPDDEFFYNDYFIDKLQWYYFCFLIDKEKGKIKVFVNEKPIYSFSVNKDFIEKELEIKFDNEKGNGTIEIDRLRVYEFEDKVEEIFNNKFKLNPFSENNKVLFKYDFDETYIGKLEGKNNIKFYNCELSLSSALIYSDLPELDVEVFTGFYTIRWQNKNTNNKNFILERSDNGINFYDMYKVEATGEEDEKFIYTDSKSLEGKVIFYRLKISDKMGRYYYSNTIKVGVTAKQILEVKPNFPNPFNPSTEITVNMLEDAEVEIVIFDITGKEIERLYNGLLNKGLHIFKFNGSDYPSGIYLCKVSSGQVLKVQKMILTK
ncbi:MAG TPA: T9SS type A sorting domain-containing protein [Melioribacteraceae bacterium]|nr:T9SS type A sorting domain-containing protein [Melioribacteraceae bacterium]